MPSFSPTSSSLNPAFSMSIPRMRDNELRRMHSLHSVNTPRRSIMENAQTHGNAMKVYVRVRPFNEREVSLNMSNRSTIRIDVDNQCFITLLDPQKDFKPRETFSFTRCFWSVFEESDEDGMKGKSVPDFRASIDAFASSNPVSGRANRNKMSLNASTNHLPPASVRARTIAESFANFEGAGSGPVVVPKGPIPNPPYSSQQDVYIEVGRPILENSLEGYNGCIFAYGQTGSGKTFCMFGYCPKNGDFAASGRRQSQAKDDDFDEDEFETSKLSMSGVSPARFHRISVMSSQNSQRENFGRQMSTHGNVDRPVVDFLHMAGMDSNELQGIIPRVAKELFDGLHEKRDKDPSHSYRVEVAYYEIYNEKVFDLIRPQKDAELRIRHNPVSGPYVEGLTSRVVDNEREVAKLIRKGNAERRTASTRMNDRSSRSHAIITLNIMQLFLDQDDNTRKQQSKLNLVDLAGSERTGAVGAEGKQFVEGTKINLSLTTLGRVIDCLADLSQNKSLSVPVPYRDSNLTWLLVDSLGGNSKTSMLATVSPHSVNFDEMRQTIRYASRAKQIVNKAVINEDPQVRQIRLLTAEVERLKKVIRDAGHNEFSRDYVVELQNRNVELEKRCQEQEKMIVELQATVEEYELGSKSEMPSRAGSAKRFRSSHFADAHSRRRRSMVDDNGHALGHKPRLIDPLSSTDDSRHHHSEAESSKEYETTDNASLVEEMSIRIKNLKKEVDKLRKLKVKQEDHLDRYSFFYVDWALDIMRHTMVEKEDEFIRHVVRFVIDQNAQLGKDVRLLQKSHREEIDQTNKRHVQEMEELHKLSSVQIKESIEKSNDFYQQLIDSHVEKLNAAEERIKNDKKLYEKERKRLMEEKESARASYEEQLKKLRSQHQSEIKRLRDQVTSGVSERQRSGEVVKRLQEDHEREINQRQEEMDRCRREKDQEITRLKQQISNEALRQESDKLERDRQRRSLEHEVNELRRELIKEQAERNRMEQQHQTEMLNLTQQQERLVTVSNGLLSDWENRPSAMEASFSQLRVLLQSQEYLNFRARLREATQERKDYTAELEAVEERKQRDTQRLREIVQQLRQNQEESKASIQRFEEDFLKQISDTSKPRKNIISSKNNTSSANINRKK